MKPASLRRLMLSRVLAILFGSLCFGGVGLHFFLAKMQFEHDGDNMYFIPVAYLVLVTFVIFGVRYLKLNSLTKTITFCLVACGLLFSLIIYLGAPTFLAAIVVLPVILAILTGASLGGVVQNNESEAA
jgi:hypothetical protein